ncbi:PhnE/PtxC family ABC transporter permease [Roseibacillus ishigakijimensis]|uniref:ABC transporter permease subunit n=1 Tax=Roseibacillus ishigakijimensis TaxID=454146 RepID=A0A934VLI4_9BACT|nr:ABC transporter permease subunit [Roseibacillus ishigakijimensis]MBK1832925.1 ABC transporter permease subunit [Roseibacillus ishigakijimensis]
MKRRWFLLSGLLLFLAGLWILGAHPCDLLPSENGRRVALDFFQAAFQPALDYQSPDARRGDLPFWQKVLTALWLTVRYAAVAMSLALVIGIVGGILGARRWWSRPSRPLEALRRFSRLAATALRSVHELMWALLFISAVGTSPLAAVLALALPYGGTLAKVFSELLDEADASATETLRAIGGGGFASFLAGAAVRALPDLVTYALYRLECAVRSSAVLGFVGIPTIGYHLSTAYEDGHYREIWSYLYALLAVVIFFEWSGTRLRALLAKGVPARRSPGPGASLSDLWRARPRSRFVRAATGGAVVLTLAAWLLESDWTSGVSLERRWQNLQRFGQELIPYPLRAGQQGDTLGQWLHELLIWEGLDALWRTLHVGTTAALLAGAAALVGMIWGTRSLARACPRGVCLGGKVTRRYLGQLLRGVAMLARSLPEFILAFLLLQVFGPTVWALILALAIHNGGILLRLGAEVLDNAPSRAAEVILLQGGTRSSAYLGALLPANFNRLVLYLFYRWETCIREATVLGMLGVGSLGFLITEAGVRFYYDEMLLWVLLGASLVFAGDLTSDWVRKKLREGR